MDIKEAQRWINDYLDLYLYAGNIDDGLWQQEILEKLKTFSNETQEFILNPQ